MLRKIFAVLLGTLAVSAAIYASGCNEVRLDAFAYSETSYVAQTDEPVQVPVVSQAAITRFTHEANAIQIYWGKAEGANGYDIYRQSVSNKDKWDYIARITDDGTSGYTIYRYNASTNGFEKSSSVSGSAEYRFRDDTGLSQASVYTYKVIAFADTDGEITYASESEPFSAATDPAAPEITTFTHAGNAIRIYWNKTEGASGYEIYRYDTSAQKWAMIKTIYGNETFNYRDEGLSSGTVYKYQVKAFINCNGQQVYGTPSKEFSAVTNPPVPTITKFTHANSAVRIYWDKINGASGYEIYRYYASSKIWVKIKTIYGNNTFNYRDEGLFSGTVYKYKVKAFINCSGQKVQGTASKTLVTATNPVATSMTGYKRMGNGTSATLYWRRVQCSGYYIQQYRNGAWITVKTVASPDTLNATLTNLETNKYLYYRIKPYTKAGSTLVTGLAGPSYSIILPYTVTAIRGSVMKSSPSWSSTTLLGFNSGAIFYRLGTSGNWLRVEYNGTVGYIYNKAVTGRANYSAITTATLPVVADDWLFDNGTSISAIFNYAKAMYYATTPKLSVEEMAVRAFKLRSGACYYYASLMYYLLDRAGYDVYIIQGESRPNNEHWWNLVRTSEGWRHYDATPFRDHDYLYGTTDAQTAKYMTKWDRSKYPAAN